MKTQLWKLAGFLAIALATSPGLGQTNRGDTIADIPFAFTVADHTLPPGRYTVTRLGETTLRIFSPQDHGAIVLTTGVEGKAPESVGKMAFNRYGDRYFLSEVWIAASGTGRRVFRSRSEEELAKRHAEREIAVLRLNR